ncbi:MAG TPA: TonB-dependent receptor [Candidatus Baltobacteraceae bacterium]|jgi:outer membrane receptor protein involved in Fe transport|nr:TonB-dependent receptor [Candidatus Baltobacteraceae bacterium]
MRFIFPVLSAVSVLAFIPLASVADVSGSVTGTLTLDGSPAAGIVVSIIGDGSRYTATTDKQGRYFFSAVPFGRYQILAGIAGQPTQTRSLDVASGSLMRSDFVFGKLKDIAVVTAKSTTGAGGTPVSQNILTHDQLATLPTNNSLNSIVQTVPGIVRFSYGEPVAHGFHGLTYEVDGAPLPLATSSNFAEVVDPKTVDRVEVLTGAFPAEYGGSRQGAVVNIVTNNANDIGPGNHGQLTYGVGNQGQELSSLDDAFKIGAFSAFVNGNVQQTDRGLDAPTYTPIHDAASQADEFLRIVGPPNQRWSEALNISNQLALFQIPINTDPNNPNDPQVSVPGTDDVQREYDRFASLNLTRTSNDKLGYVQVIPWVRSTRLAYDGDLANDVLATFPDPVTGNPDNLVGLQQDRQANYVGIRAADFRASGHHQMKTGIDVSRESAQSTQTFAQFALPNVNTNTAQAGTQIGIYAQDKWSPSQVVSFDYGVRYDHSTGYVSGNQISPRIGVNVAPDQKNVLHAYYGKFYAAPQLEDVRQDCVVLQGGCTGTPVYDLKPETDYYGEVGVRHHFSSNLDGYVNYFQRNVVNVLDTTQLLNTPIFAVFNNAIGRAKGVEFRIEGQGSPMNSWFLSGTISQSLAGGISGSTFLFDPSTISDNSLQPEDHDQTYEANGAFTHHFGKNLANFATLQTEFGSGFPVQFENGTGRLPPHLTFDGSIGHQAGTHGSDLGYTLGVQNLLNHQYIIKIANGFNTTQIANGRSILFRITAPFGG